MKKLFCIIALAAISFGSVQAVAKVSDTKTTLKTDTTKKMKKDTSSMKMKKDTTKKW